MKDLASKTEPTDNIETLVAQYEEENELTKVEKPENDDAATDGPSKKDVRAPPKRKRKQKNRNKKSNRQSRDNSYRVIFPHFPVCCNLKLMASVQILAVLDVVLALITIFFWLYLLQYDPFIERVKSSLNTRSNPGPPAPAEASTPRNLESFYESTTVLGPPIFGEDVDAHSESIKYSKLAYLQRHLEQEVEQGCGQNYYVEYLFEHKLNVTRKLFYAVIRLNYVAELIYIFNAVSILTATCCYVRIIEFCEKFSFTSARASLIVIWMLELVPLYMRMGLIIVSQSERFCIFEYGLTKSGLRGLTLLSWLSLIPLIFYRPYKILVFSCFIHSLFTSAENLQLRKKLEEMTLKEYIAMQEGYLRMDKDRDKSSSADEENETIM